MSVTVPKDATDSSFKEGTDPQGIGSKTFPERLLDSDLLIKDLKARLIDQELRLAQLETFTGTLLGLMCDKGLISEEELHHLLEVNALETTRMNFTSPKAKDSKPRTKYRYHS